MKSVYATSDKIDSVVKVYAKGSAGKTAPTYNAALNDTTIAIANASFASSAGYTTNDSVVYVHANGTVDYRTVSTANATNVVLSSGISVAGASGDYLYEVTQQDQWLVGHYGTGTGTNDTIDRTGAMLFATPGDSPLYVVLDGTATAVLSVSVEK